MYIKMMNNDMTAFDGFQYEIGKTYQMTAKPEICRTGFHFSDSLEECLWSYNNIKGDKRLFEVEPLGSIVTSKFPDSKFVTNKIKIVRELDIEKYIEDNDLFNNTIYVYQRLSESFIHKHRDRLDWSTICACQNLSEDFIINHSDYVNFYKIVHHNHHLSEEFIERFVDDKFDWLDVCMCQELSEEFMEKHIDNIRFPLISKFQELSDEFIEKYKDKLDFDDICINKPEEFIYKYEDRINNWDYVFSSKTLSEEFIERYHDKINDWDALWRTQNLSIEFIERHIDKVNWETIVIFQRLTEEFIEKYKDNLNMENVFVCQKYLIPSKGGR